MQLTESGLEALVDEVNDSISSPLPGRFFLAADSFREVSGYRHEILMLRFKSGRVYVKTCVFGWVHLAFFERIENESGQVVLYG